MQSRKKRRMVAMILWLEQARGFNSLFRPCREVSQLSSQSLDRRLSLVERISMRIHFLYCKWCAWYLKQLRQIRQTARDPEAAESALMTECLSTNARKRILETVSSSLDRPES